MVIDEVHLSQSGGTTKRFKKILSNFSLNEFSVGEEDDDLTEVGKLVLNRIRSRGRQYNISYFEFSGIPKNKTFEIFGTKTENGFVQFHHYSMMQEISDGLLWKFCRTTPPTRDT